MKNAYIFPGQGSQHPGMGQLLFDQFDQAKALFRRADEILGYSISDVMFHGTEEQLKQTKYTQLAMFLHGYRSTTTRFWSQGLRWQATAKPMAATSSETSRWT